MSREKALVKNTIIYAIRNFGSKFIAFFLLPLYTFYLSKSDFGFYNIVLTTTSLLLSIITLQMSDGMYRYMLTSNTEDKKKVYFTNAIFIVILNALAGSSIFLIINVTLNLKYAFLIMLMFLLSLFYSISNQAVRGLNKNLYFSLSGIIVTVVTITSNIVLIAF